MKKFIFNFSNKKPKKNFNVKTILGGKGANLAEMEKLGLPVPPGFTISVKVCDLFYKNKKKLPSFISKLIKKELKLIEKASKKKFGDLDNPLLVSVRSGAKVSMPGMMDTILNLGLNDKIVLALINKTSNPRFVQDSYRRFIQMYGSVVLNIKSYHFEELIENYKLTKGVIADTDLDENDWGGLINNFKDLIKKETKKDFPQDVLEQLYGAVIQLGLLGCNVKNWKDKEIQKNPFFCPDKSVIKLWEKYLLGVRKSGSSCGAIIEIRASGIPIGLGAPIYSKLDADIAAALMSINAVKGVNIGSGMYSALLSGLENSDEIRQKGKKTLFKSNNAGGILGGISSGQDIIASFAVKPTSSILLSRKTINKKGKNTEISVKGRHDPCVGIRAVPVGEAMMNCVLLDHYLMNKAQCK